MIHAIIVIGKPGCGKSVMIWYLGSLLSEDHREVAYLSDRLGLEEAVLKDTRHARPSQDGSKIGRHSKLIADGPPGHRKVHVLDGLILNQVHRNMIAKIAKNRLLPKIIVAEYAIGPDIHFGKQKEPLRQSARHLVGYVKKYHLTDSVFILDVEANLTVRAYRESKRPDAMAPETFRAYFPDGGEMTKEQAKELGSRYYQFINRDDDHDGYFSESRYVYEMYIRPGLKLTSPAK
ncbi:hypothetical protein HYV22_03890 [Candidatus Gottesmanbacteria bacterium]|nr:hypothetical protein [Candidatus Gottesmanbacteria bacterium]